MTAYKLKLNSNYQFGKDKGLEEGLLELFFYKKDLMIIKQRTERVLKR